MFLFFLLCFNILTCGQFHFCCEQGHHLQQYLLITACMSNLSHMRSGTPCPKQVMCGCCSNCSSHQIRSLTSSSLSLLSLGGSCIWGISSGGRLMLLELLKWVPIGISSLTNWSWESNFCNSANCLDRSWFSAFSHWEKQRETDMILECVHCSCQLHLEFVILRYKWASWTKKSKCSVSMQSKCKVPVFLFFVFLFLSFSVY